MSERKKNAFLFFSNAFFQILGRDLAREDSEPRVSEDPTQLEAKGLPTLVGVGGRGGAEPTWGVSCEPVRQRSAWVLLRGEDASADPARFKDPLLEPLSARATESRGPPRSPSLDEGAAGEAEEGAMDACRSSEEDDPPFSLSFRFDEERRTKRRSLSLSDKRRRSRTGCCCWLESCEGGPCDRLKPKRKTKFFHHYFIDA